MRFRGLFKNLFKIKGVTASEDDLSVDEETNRYRVIGQLKFIIVVLLLVIVWQSHSLTRAAESKIVNVTIPNTIYEEPKIKVGNGWGNDFYFKVWSDRILYESANFTPSTAKDKLNMVFKMIKPEKAAQYVGPLANLNNLILRNMVTQDFTIKGTSVKFYSDKSLSTETANELETVAATITYNGIAMQTFGRSKPIDKQCSYTISLILDGGHLYANSYDTTCFSK